MSVKKKFMVFDVESIGLHGEGFSVGWCVVDDAGKTIASAQYACDPSKADGPDDGRQWVSENIPVPNLGYNCPSPRAVRDEFWRAWDYSKKQGVVLVADCPWPVEAGFLRQCILDDPSRKCDGPYPFIDVASVRLAVGLDPLVTCERNQNELPVHDPLCDARQSARLLIEALDRHRELLTLRSRDAGDASEKEINRWHDKIKASIQIDYFDPNWNDVPTELIGKMRDELITRGQQLRESKRREQVMAHHCQKYVEMTWEQAEAAYDAAEPVEISREEIDRIVDLVVNGNEEDREDEVTALEQRISRLNVEYADLEEQLRSSREEVERLKEQIASSDESLRLERSVTDQQHQEQISALQSQLAAMQGGSVEEVEALSGDFTVEECEDHTLIVWMNRNKKLAELARTAIQQRDEVVGLVLKTANMRKPDLVIYLESLRDEGDQAARLVLEAINKSEIVAAHRGEVGE